MVVGLMVGVEFAVAVLVRDSLPADGKQQIGRRDRFPYVRVGVLVTAFALLVTALGVRPRRRGADAPPRTAFAAPARYLTRRLPRRPLAQRARMRQEKRSAPAGDVRSGR